MNKFKKKTTIKIGSSVKPLRKLKRKLSYWGKHFKSNKTYKVIDFDELNGEKLLVLKTGEGKIDYQLVYPDEVKLI